MKIDDIIIMIENARQPIDGFGMLKGLPRFKEVLMNTRICGRC